MTESSLDLVVAGRTYTVPQPPARVGLALQASWTVAHARKSGRPVPPYAVERMARYDNHEADMYEESLGPVWGQMIAADVTIAQLNLAGLAAYVWICTGSTAKAQMVLDPDAAGDDDGPKA